MHPFLALAAAVGGFSEAPNPSAVPQPPEAAFTIDRSGWLTIRLTDGGRPVPGAAVRCLVGSHVFAEGETDDNGSGSFPAPTAGTCQMVFDLGKGLAAPIPLTFIDKTRVVPTSAAVRDGSLSCCRPSAVPPTAALPPPPESAPAPEPAQWWPLAAVGLGIGVGVSALTLLAFRRYTRTHLPPISERSSDV